MMKVDPIKNLNLLRNVYLIGGPNPDSHIALDTRIESFVAGKFVNVFDSSRDSKVLRSLAKASNTKIENKIFGHWKSESQFEENVDLAAIAGADFSLESETLLDKLQIR